MQRMQEMAFQHFKFQYLAETSLFKKCPHPFTGKILKKGPDQYTKKTY
jgi:hypothetical protein